MTHQSIYFGLARREVEAIFIQVELAGIGQGVYFAVSYFARVVFGFVHIVSSLLAMRVGCRLSSWTPNATRDAPNSTRKSPKPASFLIPFNATLNILLVSSKSSSLISKPLFAKPFPLQTCNKSSSEYFCAPFSTH